jgi:Uma2 family endonuclease
MSIQPPLPMPSDSPVQLEIPPLESGDRLTRPEFERRYTINPHIKKAELIEGVVYVASPLRFRRHGKPHGQLITWLGTYEAATPNVEIGIEPTVRLDLDNEPQPDCVLLISPEAGGQARIDEDDYIEGAPELVAEVAASSAAYDLGDKKNAYRRNGVQEYLVLQVFENRLDWFVLQDGEYIALMPDEQGIIHSRVFPGLRLAVPQFLNGEMNQVLAVLQVGLNSAEHDAFRKRLKN